MRYRVTHTTTYEYTDQVGASYNEACLLPRTCPQQALLGGPSGDLAGGSRFPGQRRFFRQSSGLFLDHQPHHEFSVTAISEVQVYPAATQLNFSQGMAWENVREVLQENLSPQNLDARQYVLDSPLISASHELSGYAQDSFHAGRPLLEAVYDLMQRIYHDFTFDPEFTTLATPLSEVLEHRRGVCQDFAHLAIGCLRSQGLAARYVSGYIETVPPPGEEKLVGADASHAWFAVFIPEQGWMDFDPTNNQVPNDQHITVAWGRDYSDVTPLKGVIFGGKDHELSVSVDVQRLGE